MSPVRLSVAIPTWRRQPRPVGCLAALRPDHSARPLPLTDGAAVPARAAREVPGGNRAVPCREGVAP